ncbi:MAG: sugar-binding protein [Candidatus Omnitrophota bacterium]
MAVFKRIFLALTVFVFSCSTGYGEGGRWKFQEKVPTFFLPKLTQPLVLDGNLNEWTEAACVPVRYQSYVCHLLPSHKWLGPADAGMEFFCAWNKDGLCLAAVVADDEIYNDREPQKLWQQDGVEIFLDGRAGERFMKAPYSKGAYQIFTQPPVNDRKANLAVNALHGEIKGLKIAGTRTRTGYIVEMQIPWSAFPEFKPGPGALFGIQFGLDDYDSRDGNAIQPLMMTWRGAKDLGVNPAAFMRWTLTNRIPQGPEVSLDGIAAVDGSRVLSQKNDLPFRVEVGRNLAKNAKSVEVWVRDWTGKKVLTSPYVPLTPLRTPWESSLAGRTTLRFEKVPDGSYLIITTFKDTSGRPLGLVEKPVLIVRNTLEDALDCFRRADLPVLSQKKPMKAAAYLGAAASLERLKRNLETGDAGLVSGTVVELTGRLGLLETGFLPEEADGLYDLLALTADPEAQVVVEYPEPNLAEIAFYWGAIPLASGTVEVFPTVDAARAELEKERFWVDPGEKTTLEGWPAFVSEESLRYQPFRLKNFAPDSQVFLVIPERKWADALDVKYLSCVRVSAAVILDDCPPTIRNKVAGWAKETKIRRVNLPEAQAKGTAFLVAGNIRSPEITEKFQGFSIGILNPVKTSVIRAAEKERLIKVACPSRQMAENVVRLILAKKTIPASEVDTLRGLLVKALKPRISQKKEFFRPDQRSLFCGDLHLHSFYSFDGETSPVGVALSTMYNYMDFAVLTDHNTIEGARSVQNLLSRYKLGYPLIVGEEITTKWAHLNAYPLTETIPANLSPEETVKAAHNQGAIIQWNHPGYTKSEWEMSHLETGPAGTGIGAWEHPPFNYREQRDSVSHPVIVGSTDSHSGTFARDSERTVILALTPKGEAVASAIKKGDVLAIIPYGERVLYGSDRMASLFLAALNDRSFLKKKKSEQLKIMLKEADITGLLRASPAKPE